jgi:hypothetical protein
VAPIGLGLGIGEIAPAPVALNTAPEVRLEVIAPSVLATPRRAGHHGRELSAHPAPSPRPAALPRAARADFSLQAPNANDQRAGEMVSSPAKTTDRPARTPSAPRIEPTHLKRDIHMRLPLIPLITYAIATAAAGCVTEMGGDDGADNEGSETSPLLTLPCTDSSQAATNCGGGGGGGPPPPPAPVLDTSGSYLNASARAFFTQAGVSDAASVGATKWINACRVSAFQGAVTFNSGVTNNCIWANTIPGWVILEVSYDVLRNDNSRGSASASSIQGSVTISTVDFGSKFTAAYNLALGVGNVTAAQNIQLEYQRLSGYSFSFDGTGNNLAAFVTANGGLFEGSFIDVQAKAKLLRIY